MPAPLQVLAAIAAVQVGRGPARGRDGRHEPDLRDLPFGILMSLEPAAAALAGLVVLGQRLGAVEILALVLVTLASAGVTLSRRNPSGASAQNRKVFPN